MSTKLKGPQTDAFNKRSRRGKFRWTGMVMDGNPASLGQNEPRILVNVRRDGEDFVARGGQEKMTTKDFGPVKGLADTHGVVMQRVYFTQLQPGDGSSILGFLEEDLANAWAAHHASFSGGGNGQDSQLCPPDLFADSIVYAASTDIEGSTFIPPLTASSGIFMIPVSEMFANALSPFPAAVSPGTQAVMPTTYSSGPVPIVVHQPAVIYSYASAGPTLPAEFAQFCRVHGSYLLIIVKRRTAPALGDTYRCDVFDGSRIVSQESIQSAARTLADNVVPSFMEPWRGNMVMGFDDDGAAVAEYQRLYLRPLGAPPQTWSSITPAAGTLTRARAGVEWRTDFWVIGDNAGTPGAIWKYDGATMTLEHTIASSVWDYGVIAKPGKLYFAYVRSDGAGAFSVRIATYDGTTWTDSALNVSALFGANPPPRPASPSGGTMFVPYRGGACFVADSADGHKRAYFTDTDNILGAWHRTNPALVDPRFSTNDFFRGRVL